MEMHRVPLFEEYRLVERSENDINGAWKGAHLLLFFLAFVFGSFCTFCFHMLMYLFDEKCVLFPKLLSLTSLKHNVIYEFVPSTKDLENMPVDFVSTQWVEKSTCSLPTYVPLVSGIFGLVWTTMFLMCSTGSRTLTGLQRPWRVLPPVFLFSLAMGGLCVYSSAVTHYGLQELCLKLGEITGSPTCTYTVNVATLTYERRIRGVYQATRLTILTAWLHTACWLLSALLALVRILLAIDFQLVRVTVELHGDIDKMLEKHEVQIRTVLPETLLNNENEFETKKSEIIFMHKPTTGASEFSLMPDEAGKLAKVRAYDRVSEDHIFIVKLVYDFIKHLPLPELSDELLESSPSSVSTTSVISRQFELEKVTSSHTMGSIQKEEEIITDDVNPLVKVDSFILMENKKSKKKKDSIQLGEDSSPIATTSKQPDEESLLDVPLEMSRALDNTEDKVPKKSNLKTIGVQTEKEKRNRGVHVKISDKRIIRIKSDSDETIEADEQTSSAPDKKDVDKETQTREKEKQD